MLAGKGFVLGIFLGWVIGLLANTTLAEQRALLVGVSDYRDQIEGLNGYTDLNGPPNDVALMWNLLTERGFDPSNIIVLADSLDKRDVESKVQSAGPPTRAAILGALRRLASEAAPGDVVYIHFSGHGGLQPDLDDEEFDRLDEIFLPIDSGRWDHQTKRTENAIVDDELGPILAEMNAKGAFVWAVFDLCHAGTLLRGGADARVRGVTPESLGIPAAALSGRAVRVSASEPPLASGNSVAFYAVHPRQYAVERRLPRSIIRRTPYHGVFTWALASALRQGGSESYRDLARATQQIAQYLAAGSPLFEGNLDQRILSQEPAERKLLAVADANGLRLNAGSLDGVAEGAVLALYAIGPGGSEERLGHVRVQEVNYDSAALVPVWGGPRAVVDWRTLPHITEARFIERPIDHVLRVSAEPGTFGSGDTGDALRQAVDSVKTGSSGKSPAPVRYEWVGLTEDPDYILERSGGHLTFADPLDGVGETGRLRTPAIRLPGSESVEPERLAANIGDALRRLAKARSILHYAALPGPEEKLGEDLVIESFIYQEPFPKPAQPGGPPDNRRCHPFEWKEVRRNMKPVEGILPRAGQCDVLVFALRNQGERPIDVTGLYIDRAAGITRLRGNNNPKRLGRSSIYRNGPVTHMYVHVGTWNVKENAPLPVGTENVAFVAVERPDRAPMLADFSRLSQETLSVYGGPGATRGAWSGAGATRFGRKLLEAAFPEIGVQRDTSTGRKRERAEIRVFSVRVVAP